MSEKEPTKKEKQPIQNVSFDCLDMMMNAPIGIFTSTPDGRFVDVNPAMARMFGYDSPQEMMNSIENMAVQFYVDPKDRDEIQKFLEQHDERLNYECRFVRKDGSLFWASNNVRAVRDEKGNVVHFQSFFSDITERKRTEEALFESEQRYRTLIETFRDLIYTTDNKGFMTYANPELEKTLGYEKGELNGQPFTHIVAPDHINAVRNYFKRAMKGESIPVYEVELVCKNETKISVEFNIITLLDSHGKPSGRYGIGRDITEWKKADRERREYELRLASIINFLPDATLAIDREGRVIAWNRAIEEMTGVQAAEVLGKCDYEYAVPFYGTRRPILIDFVLSWSPEVEKEYSFIRKEGDTLYTETAVPFVRGENRILWGKASPLFDAEGKVVGAIESIRDITDRKRMEAALQKSEKQYRLIVEMISDVVWIAGMDLRTIYITPSVQKVTGFTAEEVMLKTFDELVTPDSASLAWNTLTRELVFEQEGHTDPERTVNVLLEYYHKDGSTRWLETIVRGIRDDQGVLTSLHGVSRDVTERKCFEEKLRLSEEWHRSLMEDAPAGFCIIDKMANIQYVNKIIEEVTGYSRHELVGRNSFEMGLFSEDAVRKLAERFTMRMAGIIPDPDTIEIPVICKDGRITWIEMYTRIQIEDGVPAGAQIVMVNITERKRAEESLRESEEKYRFLTESMTDIVWTTDLNMKITYVSPSITKVLGFAPEERRLQNVEDTMTKESYDTAMSLLARELEEERNGTLDPDRFKLVQTEFCHKEGHTVWMETMVRFIRDREGNPLGMYGLSRDITERKHAEEEKEKLKEQLNRAQKLEAIGTLAGGIAHDFNNLLMGIQGNASLMMLELDPSDPHYEWLEQIEEQVKCGADLTRQLMGFARGGRYEMKPTDMNEIIEKTAVMFGRTKKEITLYKKYEKDLWVVEADRTQMGQVFMNLFVNAWQAMPGGGEIFLETENILLDDSEATGLALSPGKYVRFSVTDTGTGMDAKTLERIFDPFFTTKGMGRGTGLGLATVYGIIKGHGGVIHVTSNPGEGSTFVIYLPASEKAVVREMNTKTEALRGTETILLVDDEAIVLDVTSRMLRSLGYKVHCSGSGQEAVAILCEKKIKIDLVILDMIMPGMSGSETFGHLRKIDPDMKVLLSSGYSIDGTAQELIEKGCNGFLQKPFMVAELAREVRAVLDSEKNH